MTNSRCEKCSFITHEPWDNCIKLHCRWCESHVFCVHPEVRDLRDKVKTTALERDSYKNLYQKEGEYCESARKDALALRAENATLRDKLDVKEDMIGSLHEENIRQRVEMNYLRAENERLRALVKDVAENWDVSPVLIMQGRALLGEKK